MKRKALIISNPGEQGASNYCEGVNKDVTNYTTFFTSPIGGLWFNTEVTHMPRPSVEDVRKAIANVKQFDYSIVIFAGHGWHSKDLDSTILELRKGQEIDSAELRNGCPKETLIIDCCRVVHTGVPITERLAALAKTAGMLNASFCRQYYDLEIARCSASLIVTHACSVNEKAGDDSANGGVYSYNLLRAARRWAETQVPDPKKNYSVLSIVQAHEGATPLVVRQSGDRQHPRIEKPRSEPYFPFCIVA